MKHSSYLFAVVTVIFLCGVTSALAAFPDVHSSHPNADAIEYVQSQGIVSGYPNGTYGAENPVNRAEFMKIVVGAVEGDITGSRCFPDVQDEWFARFVCYGKAQGIISGYPDGTFQPEKPISFVEGAKIIVNAFDIQTTQATPWYKPFVLALEPKKTIPMSILSLDKKLTRGEMAEIIYRLHAGIQSKASRSYAELSGEETNPVPSDEPNNFSLPLPPALPN